MFGRGCANGPLTRPEQSVQDTKVMARMGESENLPQGTTNTQTSIV